MNINKIRLSGTTYSIQDENATKTVELTQAEYDALSPKDPNTFYIITDATAGDLSNYYTKTETDNAITAATSTKQDTLVSGTNIKTINGETLLGEGNIEIQGGSGGGKAIEAGTNISITTGETADTINCTLNASNGSGNHSFVVGRTNFANKWCSYAEGEQNLAGGKCSHAEGSFTYANADYSHSEGYKTNANNMYEHASGVYNVSNSASTTFGDSRNTLFSVGNGTDGNARHNAFEIRQNGDIYLNDGSKLQDTVSATTANTTALGGLKLVKLTQSEYDALATKDNSTLYVIVN